MGASVSPAPVDTPIVAPGCAGGGDVVRKGGLGRARSDLLIINKPDLAEHVDVDVPLMVQEGLEGRDHRPVIALSRKDPGSIQELTAWVLTQVESFAAGRLVPQDPGPMAPHSHADATHPHDHEDHHQRENRPAGYR